MRSIKAGDGFFEPPLANEAPGADCVGENIDGVIHG
jgi:hypothetical protein